MGFSQHIQPLPGSGHGSRGNGAPIFVGRNRRISLILDITDAPLTAAASVYLETASSQFAKQWRKLGTSFGLTGTGTVSTVANGADAFVRAQYVNTLAGTEPLGYSLTGQAQCVWLDSAARTGAFAGPAIDMAQYHGGRFAAVVVAPPATVHTLTLGIERSGDGITWEPVESFKTNSQLNPTQISSSGEYQIASADLDRFVRIVGQSTGDTWTVGVSGTAHLIFARTRDRARVGIRNGAIPNTSSAQYLDALLAATKTVISYYNRYDHPLRAWEEDTTQATIALADWRLLTTRSKDPARSNETERGGTYVETAKEWTSWLALVAGVDNGGRKLVPSGIVDSAPANERGEVTHWQFDSNKNPWDGV